MISWGGFLGLLRGIVLVNFIRNFLLDVCGQAGGNGGRDLQYLSSRGISLWRVGGYLGLILFVVIALKLGGNSFSERGVVRGEGSVPVGLVDGQD